MPRRRTWSAVRLTPISGSAARTYAMVGHADRDTSAPLVRTMAVGPRSGSMCLLKMKTAVQSGEFWNQLPSSASDRTRLTGAVVHLMSAVRSDATTEALDEHRAVPSGRRREPMSAIATVGRVACALTVGLALLQACSASEDRIGAEDAFANDTLVEGSGRDTEVSDSMVVECCPVWESFRCALEFPLGGAVLPDRPCRWLTQSISGGMESSGWVLEDDEFGCPEWHIVGPVTSYCVGADAGPATDTSASEVGEFDAGHDASDHDADQDGAGSDSDIADVDVADASEAADGSGQSDATDGSGASDAGDGSGTEFDSGGEE